VLRDARADALLVLGTSSRDPDLLPFAGSARLGECFVVARADGGSWLGYHSRLDRGEAAATGMRLLDPATLQVGEALRGRGGPGAELARSLRVALARAGVSGGRVALAGRYPTGGLAEALARLRRHGFGFVSGHRALLRLRRPKVGAEREEIRQVAAVTARAFLRVAAVLREAAAATARPGSRRRSPPAAGAELAWRREPLTVAALRREIAATLAAAGLEEPEGNLIAPGRQGSVPHNAGEPSTVLRAGEPVVVDLFPRRRLFADCTRTFCVGEPPAVLLAAHGAVLEALALAARRARAGTRGIAIQEEVCRHFERLGYATALRDRTATSGYVHGLGHGVGFEVHELPHFRREGAADEGTLARDDVFTLEPGLYDPEAGYGVRLEDLCLLEAGGLRNLTPLPYDLDPRAWPGDDAG
jgi:Xaa-Pro aminopeptidase